jgi:hypothetical protein
MPTNAEGSARIYGMVTDAKTDKPIDGAAVNIYVDGSKENYHKTQTDLRGYYEVNSIPGDYIISISKEGYTAHKEAITLDVELEYNVKLTPSGDSGGKDDPPDDPKVDTPSSIYGTVTDAKTREPVVGAEVTIYDPIKREKYNHTRTDEKGYYKLGCEPGNYSMSISKDAYDAYTETVRIENQLEHNVQLNPMSGGADDPNNTNQSSVSGMVTDAKTREPMVEAIVYIYAEKSKDNYQKTQTDRRGNFEIKIEPGIYTISISKDGYATSVETVNIDGRAEHNVQLTPGGDSGGKDDYNKDNYTKDDPGKDDPRKDYTDKDDTGREGDPDSVGDSSKDVESNLGVREIELLLGAIIGVLVVIVILIALLLKKKKGTTEKGAEKKDKINMDEWTACSKCGSSIRMGQLSSHLDTVHPNLSKTARERMIEQVTRPN